MGRGAGDCARPSRVTRRETKRGQERTSLEGRRADVIVCGASFAGLTVARELAGSGADVLLVDRYEIGERQTSACACPTPWIEAMGLQRSVRQELPYMSFSTPFGTARYRLPWSWSSFDYRELCQILWEGCEGVSFETAKVDGRGPGRGSEVEVVTDRGTIRAPIVVDAMGWRRVMASPHYQPPEAPLSRGLEVHPAHDGGGDSLDIWIERDLVRRGYGWKVPAGQEVRIGVGSYNPRQHVRESTEELAERLGGEPVGYQGNWFPHRLRSAADDRVYFVGDSAGHCFPLSGEGIRTAFYFGVACGRSIRSVVEGDATREDALASYAAFSSRHARAFAIALRLQRLIPSLPPRLLTFVLRVIGKQALVDRSFGWYMRQTPPEFVRAAA